MSNEFWDEKAIQLRAKLLQVMLDSQGLDLVLIGKHEKQLAEMIFDAAIYATELENNPEEQAQTFALLLQAIVPTDATNIANLLEDELPLLEMAEDMLTKELIHMIIARLRSTEIKLPAPVLTQGPPQARDSLRKIRLRSRKTEK